MMNDFNADITMYMLGALFWIVLVAIVMALRKK